MALATNALSTVASFAALGTAQAAVATPRAEALINGASDSIERFCGRKFYREANIVESLPGMDTVALWLSRNPVESIASLTFDGVAITSLAYTLEAEKGRIYRPEGWAWTASVASAIAAYGVPGTEAKLIVVTYTGGYCLPKDNRGGGTYPLPYDLEEACLALATYRMNLTATQGALRTSRQAGNAAETYGLTMAATGPADIPDFIAGMLAPYERVR